MATKKDIQVCFNPHFDSVSLWIGSFGGADSPCDISRGVFAAKRGVPRILEMMDRYGIKTTWDITGHSIESFPKESELIVKYGHELGVHGYTHENPLAMSRQQEADVLDKCIELVTDLSGVRPVGYVAPWWELSPNTIELLLERGFLYDRSVMEGRLHAALSAQRGQLDQDRLHPGGGIVDEALGAGRGGRPGRAAGELVPRRRAADDVRQDLPQQPRLGEPARRRGHLARSVRLDLPPPRLCDLHLRDPSRLRRQARRCC